jgi:hypothetical protein
MTGMTNISTPQVRRLAPQMSVPLFHQQSETAAKLKHILGVMKSRSSSGFPGTFSTPQPQGAKPKIDSGIILELL